jgi:hypothetical protein
MSNGGDRAALLPFLDTPIQFAQAFLNTPQGRSAKTRSLGATSLPGAFRSARRAIKQSEMP